jgi:exopolyphosphatase/guanosine-5'-triphosphate,3'-diphosphate pyrophosphatase
MRKYKIAAAIDIGSSVVRMHISQWDGTSVTSLDTLEKPTLIGKEVFSTGYISADTVRNLSATLHGFCEKAREYEITNVHTIASTALREASNRAYILDHLKARNQLEVNVLEDTQVSSLLIGFLRNSSYTQHGKMLLVHGGTGTTDFELLSNGSLKLAHSIQTGFLKIAEMLREASDFSRHVDFMAEEYLNTFLMRDNRIHDLWKADGIVFSAGNLRPLFNLCGISENETAPQIESKLINELYDEYRELSMDSICERNDLTLQEGGILYSMLVLLSALLRLTNAKKLICTQVNLSDAMVNLLLVPGARKKHNENLAAGAVSSALDLAIRYKQDITHVENVASIAQILFENLRKILGFSKSDEMFLRIACLLHETGHYTNTDDTREASFDLVKAAHIYGLRAYETNLIANIIAPRSLLGVITGSFDARAAALSEKDILFAAKMHSLLYMADSLDFSHKQKAKISKIQLDNDSMTISAHINEDYTLEQWMFRESAALFREIAGITPLLKIGNIYDWEEN